MAGRASRGITLLAAALAWTVWCLLSAAPVALFMQAAGLLLRRTDLAYNVPIGVVVEMLLLGLTAFWIFRALARLDAPGWFWIVAPAGYVASFGGFMLLEFLGNGTVGPPAPEVILEVLAVSAVVSAGAYLGGIRRTSAGDASPDAGDTRG